MCPLRYIVLFVSAAVALVIMFWGVNDREEDKLEKLLAEDTAAEGEAPARKTRVIDFLNGRYLYDKYTLYQKRRSLQQVDQGVVRS